MSIEQIRLFDHPLSGPELKRRGMRKVLNKTPKFYVDAFENAVKKFESGRLFTAEDVREIAGDPPNNPNCMGALMRGLACKGLIVRTKEMIKAKRPSLHSSELSQWRRV